MADTATFRIKIPQEIATQYESAAAERKISVEEMLSEQLARFSTVHSKKPVVIGDKERQAIETLAKRNVTTASDIVKILETATKLNCGGVEVNMSPATMRRLKTIAPSKIPFPQWLGNLLNRLVESSEAI